MSYTTVKMLWPNTNQPAEELAELRNSHGSAPVVWDHMARRWLGAGAGGWIHEDSRLWRLATAPSVPPCQRAVMAMTFDTAYIAAENYARAAADIRGFLADFASEIEPRNVNHWPAIAEILEAKPASPAVGFHITSVGEDPWAGEWNEETEDYGPFDWSKAREVYAIVFSPTPKVADTETEP